MRTQQDEYVQGTESMPTTKIEGFFREFPWAEKYVRKDLVEKVFVSRIEPRLLDYKPRCWRERAYLEEEIFLVDKDGKAIGPEITEPVYSRKHRFWGPLTLQKTVVKKKAGQVQMDETIGEALRNLGEDAEKIRFILSRYFPSLLFLDSEGRRRGVVILYKAPQDVSIPAWIERQIEIEKAAFGDECAAIDAEAEKLPA